MKSRYDVLVIGGGPAGALAGKTAAEKGLSALIVEKRPAIGAPVRCAEGIGKEALHEFIDPDPRWISAEMTGATIVAPDGFVMKLGSAMAGSKVGYVLDRKIFDRELVWKATEAGCGYCGQVPCGSPDHGKRCCQRGKDRVCREDHGRESRCGHCSRWRGVQVLDGGAASIPPCRSGRS